MHSRTFLLLILLIFPLVFLGFQSRFKPSSPVGHPENLIRQIEKETDSEQQQELMRILTFQVGPETAIELLNTAVLESGGNKHLLSHKIGEVAYELYNEGAFFYCQKDMNNGCFHGLVLTAISEIGIDGLDELVKKCKEWSPFQYKMCLHGAGHAFTALANYDVFEAMKNCDQLARGAQKEELESCYVGLFMENVHGVHNEMTPPMHPYLDLENPLYPCNIVPEKYKEACFLNQAGWWFIALFDMDVKKTAEYCLNVPEKYRVACVDNIGRIIIALEKERDDIQENCNYLPQAALADWCLVAIAAYSIENNDQDLPFRLCSRVKERSIKAACYQRLVNDFNDLAFSTDKIHRLCQNFEGDYQHLCFK